MRGQVVYQIRLRYQLNNLHTLFNEAKINKKPLLIKSFNLNVPKWENFIDNIYSKANSNQLMEFFHGKNINDVSVYNMLDLFIPFAADEENENGLLGLKDVINLLKKDLKVNFFNVKSIINFAGYEANYWPHEDPNDVVSWHCIGNVEWRIHKGETYESYHLSPGDLFYCPKGTVHEIVVDKPRASIVLDYFNPLDN